MSFLRQLQSITQSAIPKRQTLEKEFPLNNIVGPCSVWFSNKDAKIIIKTKQNKIFMSKKSLSEETQET